MYPTLGGVSLYNPMLLLSVVSVIAITVLALRRMGYPSRPIIVYMVLGVIPGMLGAKLYSLLLHGGLRGVDIEIAGGYRYPGAIIGLALGLYWMRSLLPKGLSFPRFADVYAPAFGVALVVGRLACFLVGCCHGALSHVPWAVRYPRGSAAWYAQFEAGQIPVWALASLPVHPFPIYLLVMELGVVGLCVWFAKRKRYDGQVALLFLALHGTLKFGLEFFRNDYHPLHQVVLLLAIAAIAVLLGERYRRRGFEFPAFGCSRAEVKP